MGSRVEHESAGWCRALCPRGMGTEDAGTLRTPARRERLSALRVFMGNTRQGQTLWRLHPSTCKGFSASSSGPSAVLLGAGGVGVGTSPSTGFPPGLVPLTTQTGPADGEFSRKGTRRRPDTMAVTTASGSLYPRPLGLPSPQYLF